EGIDLQVRALFVEGHCYQLSNFGVADNSGRLPLLPHKFKISLRKNSIVTRIAPIDDNIKGFVFEYFSGLWDSQNPVSEFDAVDVIGTVMDIRHIVPLNWAGVKKLRRTLMNDP
nr:replication protein A 70 kDa DNA-binding subunit B [Tanacetum cinerariifolium]